MSHPISILILSKLACGEGSFSLGALAELESAFRRAASDARAAQSVLETIGLLSVMGRAAAVAQLYALVIRIGAEEPVESDQGLTAKRTRETFNRFQGQRAPALLASSKASAPLRAQYRSLRA